MTDSIQYSWSHYNPVRIKSGRGILFSVSENIRSGNVLVVTSPSFSAKGLIPKIQDILKPSEVAVYDSVTPNPELESIDNARRSLSEKQFSSVLAIGGGSVIDTAKVLAVMLANPGMMSLSDIFRRKKDSDFGPGLYLVAVPTTAGTGSEVTPFATVWDTETGRKFSFSNDHVYPSLALLDPDLTLSLPGQITLNTGLDAVSHALESIWNRNRTPVSLAFAMQSLELALIALPAVLTEPGNIEYRAKMQWAGTLAGLSISRTRTAIAHSISYPVTLNLEVPHGLASGFCLSELIRYYIKNSKAEAHILDIMEKTAELVDSLSLSEKILSYAGRDQIKRLIPQMFEPSRAGNYIFSTDPKFAEMIIERSLG